MASTHISRKFRAFGALTALIIGASAVALLPSQGLAEANGGEAAARRVHVDFRDPDRAVVRVIGGPTVSLPGAGALPRSILQVLVEHHESLAGRRAQGAEVAGDHTYLTARAIAARMYGLEHSKVAPAVLRPLNTALTGMTTRRLATVIERDPPRDELRNRTAPFRYRIFQDIVLERRDLSEVSTTDRGGIGGRRKRTTQLGEELPAATPRPASPPTPRYSTLTERRAREFGTVDRELVLETLDVPLERQAFRMRPPERDHPTQRVSAPASARRPLLVNRTEQTISTEDGLRLALSDDLPTWAIAAALVRARGEPMTRGQLRRAVRQSGGSNEAFGRAISRFETDEPGFGTVFERKNGSYRLAPGFTLRMTEGSTGR